MPTAVKHPFIPVELANAAFRYGHSQLRPMYAIRAGAAPMAVFPDLIGFSPVGDRAVDSMLFDVPGRPSAQRSKRIDGTLPASLIELPREITGAAGDSAYRSLAARALQRGHGTGLPSGESIAREIGARVLERAELALPQYGWSIETPLWL